MGGGGDTLPVTDEERRSELGRLVPGWNSVPAEVEANPELSGRLSRQLHGAGSQPTVFYSLKQAGTVETLTLGSYRGVVLDFPVDSVSCKGLAQLILC